MSNTTAQSLVDDGCIKKINPNFYEVQSGSNLYQVTVLGSQKAIWCDAGSCLGFRFKQDCKHCQAVKIFDDLDVEAIVPTKEMRNAINNLDTKPSDKAIKKKSSKKPKKVKPDQVEIPESRWVRTKDYA